MACGTPVVATDIGSVSEVLDQGVTGFTVADSAEAAAAVEPAMRLDRARIRSVFERRFTADRMAREYIATYERLLAGRSA